MKNLKKGLAVAMSLAMITTVLPTNVNAGYTPGTTGCDAAAITSAQVGVTFIEANKASIDVDTINVFDTNQAAIVAKLDNLKAIISCSGMIGSDYVTTAKKLVSIFAGTESYDASAGKVTNDVFAYEKAVLGLLGLVAEKEDTIEAKFSTFAKLAATALPDAAAINALTLALQASTVEESKIVMTADGTAAATGKLAAGNIADATAIQTVLENGFDGNVDTSVQAVVEKYKSVLDDMITEYREDNMSGTVVAYVTALKALPNVQTIIDGTAIPYTNASTIKALIANIEANKELTLKPIAKYADVEDETAVSDIMEALEAALDGMNEVADFAKTYKKTDAFKGLDSDIKTKIGTFADYSATNFAKFISAIDDKGTTGTGNTGDDTAPFTTEEIGKIKAFVEEITNEFYDVKVTQRSNGTYRVALEGNDNAKYLGSLDAIVKGTVEKLEKLLTSLVDKEEETTYYDALAALTTDVEKAIKAITTGIKGVTTSNLSASNVNKVIAADKAYGELTGKTMSSFYTGSANGWEDIPGFDTEDGTGLALNLTAAQKKAVKGQVATLKNLIAKMYALGLEDTDVKAGWVDLGNGNWDFFNEDGTAATKWVAAGKDWYYVKGGHMLRNSWVAQDSTGNVWYYVNNAGAMVSNTTVDGYVINANGEWHK